MTLAGLLRKKAVAAPAPAPTPERDELEEYLSAPLETDTNLDLLAYWKLNKGIDVAQARQDGQAVPGIPLLLRRRGARLLCGGQDAHDDLRKSEKDSTLEHSLFAAFNTE